MIAPEDTVLGVRRGSFHSSPCCMSGMIMPHVVHGLTQMSIPEAQEEAANLSCIL